MGNKRALSDSAWFLPFVLLVLALALGSGCPGKESEPAKIKKRVAPPAGVVRPSQGTVAGEARDAAPGHELLPLEAPAAGGAEESLGPRSTRDPFRSFIEVKAKAAREQRPAPILTPLQRYSLDQLKVVGIVEGVGARRALLEDDVGKGYMVGPGDLIGNQGGQIVAIESDRLVIEETYQDAFGETKIRQIIKRLHPAEEGTS